MDDSARHRLITDPVEKMSAQERIAEISQILAAGLLRARAKGILPVLEQVASKRQATRVRKRDRQIASGSR